MKPMTADVLNLKTKKMGRYTIDSFQYHEDTDEIEINVEGRSIVLSVMEYSVQITV